MLNPSDRMNLDNTDIQEIEQYLAQRKADERVSKINDLQKAFTVLERLLAPETVGDEIFPTVPKIEQWDDWFGSIQALLKSQLER